MRAQTIFLKDVLRHGVQGGKRRETGMGRGLKRTLGGIKQSVNSLSSGKHGKEGNSGANVTSIEINDTDGSEEDGSTEDKIKREKEMIRKAEMTLADENMEIPYSAFKVQISVSHVLLS